MMGLMKNRRDRKHAIGLVIRAQTALKTHRPDIWNDVKDMTIADGFREAGHRLGMTIPYGAPLSVMDDIADACERGA